MRKYNLNLSLIPKDAVIINHRPSFFVRNKEVLIPGIIILILLVTIIFLLFRKNRQQRALTGYLEENAHELEKSSLQDFLTKIPNRTKLYDDLTELIIRNSVCSIFIFDIDGFKQINDTYGHSVGDDVLKEVGRRLNSIADSNFTPYRLAGDEFICILRNNFEDQIESYAHKCMDLFEPEFKLGKINIPIKISLGISVYPDDASDMANLLDYADQAMYTVKKNGKNSYQRYCNIK